jgi:hypothetical protein
VAPASDPQIQELEAEWRVSLPAEHRALLLLSDGASIHAGGAVLNLGSVEDMDAWNDDDVIADSIPDLFVFGDDGGGRFYTYDPGGALGHGSYAVFLVSMGYLDMEAAQCLAADFNTLVERVLDGQSWDD